MTKIEYLELRVKELSAEAEFRSNYSMNVAQQVESEICRKKIKRLLEFIEEEKEVEVEDR